MQQCISNYNDSYQSRYEDDRPFDSWIDSSENWTTRQKYQFVDSKLRAMATAKSNGLFTTKTRIYTELRRKINDWHFIETVKRGESLPKRELPI